MTPKGLNEHPMKTQARSANRLVIKEKGSDSSGFAEVDVVDIDDSLPNDVLALAQEDSTSGSWVICSKYYFYA